MKGNSQRKVILEAAIGAAIIAGLYGMSLYSYLLFHTAVELFSICVAVSIFMIAWNTRSLQQNGYLAFVGVVYLFIAGIDLVHTLAYQGMSIFTGYGSNLATQLWIQARYLEALTLLIAPSFLRRHPRSLYEWTFASYAVVVSILLLTIFVWHIFPTCYIEGVGLTAFKKISEYVISLILLGSMARLYRNRELFDTRVMGWLAASIGLTIGSEIFFTFYVSVYGLSNLIGHIFKLASFYFIYRAIIETGLRNPYALLLRDLKQSEKALSVMNQELEQRVCERTADLATANEQLRHEIEERHRIEERIRRLNLVLRAIRNVNQLIVREKDRGRLLDQACSSLVNTRGYRASWIVLTDEERRLINSAQRGLGDSFTRFLVKLTGGDIPPCHHHAWEQPGVFSIKEPTTDCSTCVLQVCAGSSERMVIRLESGGHRYGLLGVSLAGELTADQEEEGLFAEMAGDIAYALRNMELETARHQAVAALRQSLQGTIEAIAATAESRDPYTAGHQERVALLAVAIGERIGLSNERLEALRVASLLHDIGKIAIPAEILAKPARLTSAEIQLIRSHPESAYEILKSVPFPWPIAEFILQHHERLDGSGYPKGLTSDKIVLEARIIAVADVVEAMSSHRPYRPAVGIKMALEEIEKNSGMLYAPEVVQACRELFREGKFTFTD